MPVVEATPLSYEAAINSLKDPFDPEVKAPGLIEYFIEGVEQVKAQIEKSRQDSLPTPKAVESVRPRPKAQPAPAVPSKPAVIELPRLDISGIVFKTKDPLVIINGQVLGVGDVVNEVKVLKIDRGRIDVQYKGVERVVQFNNE